ncbi:MAG: radical SAM protein, partial [Desulfobulbaceae bacterium]|nr:radical SAM protein [Desulfobulbaceae bacterium]
EELDALYSLPYTRRPHPAKSQIPAYQMIKDSVTIVRGCSGNCSFCAITRHQGPAIISRSRESISNECRRISQMDDFKGTISDLGGPTANLYGTHCAIGSCKKRDCLYPKPCANLKIDEDLFLDLLNDVSAIEGIKKLFISSGLRMELLLRTPRLLKRIIQSHTPGSMKIAPEHTDEELLCLMHKEPHSLLKKFVAECRIIAKEIGKKNIEFTPYVITAHPGSTPKHAEKLAQDMQKLGLQIRKAQDFTPTPGTLSTAMYVTGLKPGAKQPLTIPRKQSDRLQQRRILEKSLHRKIVRTNKFTSRKKK